MPPHRARVVLYSDTDSSDSSGDENLHPTQATCGTQPKKRKTERIAYEPWHKFESNAEFDGFWEDECSNWISRGAYSSQKSDLSSQYLDCKYRERQGSKCPIKLKIVQKGGTVTLEKSAGEHVGHNEEGDILTDEVKTKIKELLSDGRTPGQIRNKLQELGMQVPMLVQIENLVSREKRKSGAHAPLTDLELHQYCADNRDSNVMDPDDSYVLGYRYEKQDDKQHFIVVWTTENLWLKLQQSQLLQIDSTYGMLCLFVSQNNGLESLNKTTKELDMARKRVSFRTFVDVVEKVVHRWSSLPDYHEVKSRPIISPHTFFLAYQLKRDKRLQVHNDDGTWAYVAATENKAFSADDIAKKVESLGRHDFDSWDSFLKLRFGVHIIEVKDDWFRCSCSVGVKKVLCKHAVRLMCTKKLLNYPPDAMAEPLEERRKPKRGRPTKMKKLQVLY